MWRYDSSMSESKVTYEIDRAALDNIRAAMRDKSHVEIGLFDRKSAMLGAIHEFGANPRLTEKQRRWFHNHFGVWLMQPLHIPSRSFMRKTVAQQRSNFVTWMQGEAGWMLDAMLTSGSLFGILIQWGVWWRNAIRGCFVSQGFGQWEPLRPLTLRDNPGGSALYRTGKLINALAWKLVSRE